VQSSKNSLCRSENIRCIVVVGGGKGQALLVFQPWVLALVKTKSA
jgi:hypothetical protein